MLAFLFKKDVENECESLNSFYSRIKSLYSFNYISEERKEYLKSQMERFGYLPYPHIKALGLRTVFLKTENLILKR